MTKEQLLIIAKSGDNRIVLGAIGGIKGCNGYVEKFYLDGDQGYLTKYFGVKTPYKGWIDTERIDRVTITKKAFRELTKAMWFRPKALLNSFITLYRAEGGLMDHRLNDHELCPAVRELIRVGKQFNEDMAYCIGMFLQFSPTYRLWVQDILEELNKERFYKEPTIEILKMKSIFLHRLNSTNPERRKVELLWWGLAVIVFFKKKQVISFIEELDLEKVKIDEMDWYYCCRRGSYSFRGLSLERRLEIVKAIDEKEGNIILEI